MARAELHDVQALVKHAFADLEAASYLLLEIRERGAAARWLSDLPLTSAAADHPARGLQLALAVDGLRALGLDEEDLHGFSSEFRGGMAEPNRSRRLGDVDASAPENWRWGNAFRPPQVLLILFAKRAELGPWEQQLLAEASSHGLALQTVLATADLDGYEPFGFRDGLSQPIPDWKGELTRDGGITAEYPERIALGEFLLGYPNEYGQFTDRPLVADSKADLPESLDPRSSGAKDLGRNGTYLVLRQLSQDVRGFWRHLDGVANHHPARRRELAERMLGRRRDGCPLAGGANDFNYDDDPLGRGTPLGSHIRRANPRNGDLPSGSRGWLGRLRAMLGLTNGGVRGDLIAASRFHRLLRRGRDYGPPLAEHEALEASAASDDERGLHFVALGASLSRQFEFVQGAWLASSTFDALEGESDPLVGARASGSDFRFLEQGHVRRRLRGLPSFVQVRGGAYFFLPGLRAARHLLRASKP